MVYEEIDLADQKKHKPRLKRFIRSLKQLKSVFSAIREHLNKLHQENSSQCKVHKLQDRDKAMFDIVFERRILIEKEIKKLPKINKTIKKTYEFVKESINDTATMDQYEELAEDLQEINDELTASKLGINKLNTWEEKSVKDYLDQKAEMPELNIIEKHFVQIYQKKQIGHKKKHQIMEAQEKIKANTAAQNSKGNKFKKDQNQQQSVKSNHVQNSDNVKSNNQQDENSKFDELEAKFNLKFQIKNDNKDQILVKTENQQNHFLDESELGNDAAYNRAMLNFDSSFNKIGDTSDANITQHFKDIDQQNDQLNDSELGNDSAYNRAMANFESSFNKIGDTSDNNISQDFANNIITEDLANKVNSKEKAQSNVLDEPVDEWDRDINNKLNISAKGWLEDSDESDSDEGSDSED